MVHSIFAVARDEVFRLLATRRGWLALAGFSLVWLFILRFAVAPASRMLDGAQAGGLAELVLESLGLDALGNWPAPALAVYWVTGLYLFPLFAVLTAADQTASDRSRGTLRFLALRAGRSGIFLGRFLGQCVIQLCLLLLTFLSVLVIIAMDTPDRLSDAVASGPMIIVNLMLVLLPYLALMAWVSALAKSARQATLFAMIIWVAVSLLVSWLQARFGPLALLDWVLPGSQVSQLLRLSDWQTLQFAPVPLLHTAVLLTFGMLVMQRRDL